MDEMNPEKRIIGDILKLSLENEFEIGTRCGFFASLRMTEREIISVLQIAICKTPTILNSQLSILNSARTADGLSSRRSRPCFMFCDKTVR